MFSQTDLIDIISGKQKGITAGAIRFFLGCLTPIYRIGISFRNWKFDRSAAGENNVIRTATVPVISVGNLTTGGTGKTPLVIWITKYLQRQSLRIVLLSRGYGADRHRGEGVANDEAIEMEQRLPGIPHLQNPNRFQMSIIAVEENGAEVIVLDDAYQHRQLHRDLNIVLIDATLPFGYGRLLPRGLLREPVSNLKRADLVVLTRCDMIDASDREKIIATIEEHSGKAPIVQTRTAISGTLQFHGEVQPIEILDQRPLFSFCGIGNPENFGRSLRELNLDLMGSMIFPDHHLFTPLDLERLEETALSSGAAALVCTHKDLVKIGASRIGQLPVYAIVIDIEFVSGQHELETQIDSLVATIDTSSRVPGKTIDQCASRN